MTGAQFQLFNFLFLVVVSDKVTLPRAPRPRGILVGWEEINFPLLFSAIKINLMVTLNSLAVSNHLLLKNCIGYAFSTFFWSNLLKLMVF